MDSTNMRPVDHLVLPVTDIASARTRLSAIGFTVASDARHPFGTENACVFFADKTYLEPLGIASSEQCQASAKAGNQFTARDSAFRFRSGPEGLSAIAFATDNASADDQTFRAEGLSAGDVLEFSRPMRMPDGGESKASFKLAFAADPRSPDFFGFTCQRINFPQADRAELETHANGTIGTRRVFLSVDKPAEFTEYLFALTQSRPRQLPDEGLAFDAGNVEIAVLSPKALGAEVGLKAHNKPGLSGVAIVFSVFNLRETESFFRRNSISYTRRNNTLILAHQAGQGTVLAFMES